MNKLQIGMYKGDITPPARMLLHGQFYTRVSTHVESKLTANVFAAEKDGVQFIVAACDLIGVPMELIDAIRAQLQTKAPEIEANKVIFSAIHTHTGPNPSHSDLGLHIAAKFLPEGVVFRDTTEVPADVWGPDEAVPYLADKISDAVCKAWRSRKPGFCAPAFGRAVVGHCRRVTYTDGSARMYGAADIANFEALEGGNDSGIELLYCFDENKQPLGAIVNAACPAQVVEGQYYVSSDYWGKVRDVLEEKIGANFVTVGVCSAAGDQSPRDIIRFNAVPRPHKCLRRSEEDDKMREVTGATDLGNRIARVVLEKLDAARKAMWDDPVLQNEVVVANLPLRRVGNDAHDAAVKAFEAELAAIGKTELDTDDMRRLHILGGMLNRFAEQDTKRFYETEIHVARFGDMAFASNPFELFLDYGNQIRAHSYAAQTVLIQLANGSGGYLPTEKAERGGHYSAYVASGNVGHEGGKLLVDATVEMINKMFEE